MDIDNSFEDTMPYASILAELEYFLSELNSPSLSSLQPDIFIKNYASQEWKNLVIDTVFPLPYLAISVDNFLGINLKNIRNSIIHPVDDERRNRQQHRNIRNNPSKLHFCYACLGGLYLKAALEHLQIGTDGLREKYCMSFIENHAHVSFVEYE